MTIITRQDTATRTGTLGLALIAYGLGGSTALTNVGLVLLCAATLLVPDQVMHQLGRTPCVIAAMLSAFLLFLCALAATRQPNLAAQAWDYTSELLRIAGLPAIAAAWWLVHGRLSYYALWWLLAIGLIVGEIPCLDWAKVYAAPLPSRLVLNVTACNPNELGFLAGVHLLVSVLPLLIMGSVRAPTLKGWQTSAALLGSTIIASYPFLAAQSRGAYVAVAGAIVVVSLVAAGAWKTREVRPVRRWRHLSGAIALLGFMLALTTVTPIHRVMAERFHGVAHVFLQYVSAPAKTLSRDDGANRPLKLRLKMWNYGLHLIPERPLLGHGPGSAKRLLSQADVRDIHHFTHFHNVWIQWLVTLGALATLGFLALYGVLASLNLHAAAKSNDSLDLIAVGLWTFMAILTLVQLRYNRPPGMAFLWLLGGLGFARALDLKLIDR